MTFTVSNADPGVGDVTVLAKQPVGLGIIHLTLQIQATAIPGRARFSSKTRTWTKPQQADR